VDLFLDRIAKLPPQKLALLAAELYERNRSRAGAAEPIAITAMACRFPGGSDTPDAFWSFLEQGGDAIGPAPEERLAMSRMPADEIREKGTIWGGYLKEVDGFDPAVFGISAKEAELMDPQQRLLLEVCWEALENTGTPIDAVDSETGVFIGVSGFDFAMLGLDSDMEMNGYMLTGVAHSVIAGRLSYVFGLNGPSTVMDTACAAAASAVHLACQSLQTGECDQAIAGGVNLLLMPEVAHMLGSMQVMARDGRCKAFSADADGFVRAEGCGVIVLRRLSDAMARDEPILGMIRGSAWNQDGKSGGLTAPNGAAQERVIRAALRNAGVAPDQVSYVEAHGTGTALGDPIELSALGRVFGARPRDKPLIVGSVKTNIGHLEAAAGMASIIKVLLALRHERIPAHLHAVTLNPRIDWDSLPLVVPTQGAAWPAGGSPRIAGVSVFGISGTNVHLVISEPRARLEGEPTRLRSRTLLTVSAKSRGALMALAGQYADELARRPNADIAAFAAAANLKRAHFAHRLALAAASGSDAEGELRRFSRGEAVGCARTSFVSQHRAPRIGLLFGDQLREPALHARLYETELVYRASYDGWLAACGGREPSDVSATVGFQIGLSELGRAWGVPPPLGAGEGLGEIAAAVAASALSMQEAPRLLDASPATETVTWQAPTLSLFLASSEQTLEVGRAPRRAGLARIGQRSAGGPLNERLREQVDLWVALQVRDEDALLEELATVYLSGAPIHWRAFHAGERVDPAPLPNYPFQRKRYWPAEFGARIGPSRSAKPVTSGDGDVYRVEWREAAPTGASLGRLGRLMLLMHREGTSLEAAHAGLEASGFTVEDWPLPAGPLHPADLEALLNRRRDAAWLYAAPHGLNGAGPSLVTLEDLLAIAQALPGAEAPALYVVTIGAQAAGGAVTHPDAAPLAAFGRVLASEEPDLRATFIDMNANSANWIEVAKLIASNRSETEFAIVDGQTLMPTLTPAKLSPLGDRPIVSSQGGYIVTGAFGFIGDLTVRWLVKQGAGKVYLTGRNPPNARGLDTIEAARAAGTQVEIVVADIGEPAGVEALFARVDVDSLPLKGIIHSAAALDDAVISRQTPASLARAFGAKALGAWLLDERSRRHALDFFVLYSSAAALLGTPGQSNYAAANAYLDALAHYRRSLGLTALSLNWGLWTSTGLAVKKDVVQNGPTVGVTPITPERGMDMLGRAIASGETQVALLPFDWPVLRKALGSRRPPIMLKELLSGAPGSEKDGSSAATLLSSYQAIFDQSSQSDKPTALVEFIRRRVAELLSLDSGAAFPDDQPLLDLGLDSLMGLEVKNDLQALTGLTFPSTLFFDCPTIPDLAQFLRFALTSGQPAKGAVEEERERVLL
jgi:acyl transferase domain-containing protein/acyl carrier protein